MAVQEEVVVSEDDEEEVLEKLSGEGERKYNSSSHNSSSKSPAVAKAELSEQPPVVVLPIPPGRRPQQQPVKQNLNGGGISDISECDEEAAKEPRTASPLRPDKSPSKVAAEIEPAVSAVEAYSPSLARSPERGRKGSSLESKSNGEAGGSSVTIPVSSADLLSAAGEDHSNQPPLKRRKRTKTAKSSPGREETEHSDTETASATLTGGIAETKSSPLDHIIPTDIRFDPKSLENKPKGLVDALSNFFTPGLKRTSRTAMNSLLKPEIRPAEVSHKTSSSSIVGESSGDHTKKVRLSLDVDEKEPRDSASATDSCGDAAERRRHASAGQQQVKSLYDGLSHLYSDCDSRLRSVPTTNYNEKTRAVAGGDVGGGGGSSLASAAGGSGVSGMSADALKAGKSPERISSPHRMSDSELKEKEKAQGTVETELTKTGEAGEGEKEEKGTSKSFARERETHRHG